jgi:hypothetical protein
MPTVLASSTTPAPTTTVTNTTTQKHIYPNNLIEVYEDHLKIETYKYVTLSEYFTSKQVNLLSSSTGAVLPTIFGEDNKGRGIATDRFIKGNVIDEFLLPMPESIQFDDAIQWNLEDLRTLGRFLPTLGEQFAKGGNQASTAETLQSLAKAALPEAIFGIIEATNFFSSGQAITQGFNGKILNPYQEQIFKGLEPRTFSCHYKLVPRNVIEQNQIRNIIRRLRVNSLPDYSKQGITNIVTPGANNNAFDGLGDRWLTTPNIFSLNFISKDRQMDYLPKLKPMVLTSISSNYTPDGKWSSHYVENTAQPAPTAIELSLTFHEVEILTGKEVERDGY